MTPRHCECPKAREKAKESKSVEARFSPRRNHVKPRRLVYGKLLGISRYTLKIDVMNTLEGCNLSLEDVKWDNLTPHDAKTVSQERFLSGCEYDSSSLQIIFRSFPEPSKFATVRFPSQTEAMNAFLAKNKGFCQNGQILIRVLQ
ncbi:uncharacterized protein [Pyrus communis]|uniref:uncharacterized protein n=1 Tax=Pyrus communis TaxID=23211 RepID=UPI0035C0996B